MLYRLKTEGHEAYLVGGGVRDLMLGREPKDFDVATDATPEQVKRIFRNCRLIGRRFRLAHVFFGQEIIEVATFRSGHEGEHKTENGMILRDNVYGSLEDDAWRRDFTVNSLYYTIRDFSVVDYTGGMADLKAGLLRLIGDPVERYREDPVRMLRAVRFASKLGFRIEAGTEEPMFELAHLLQGVAPARLYEESLKLFLSGNAVQAFELLRHYGLSAEMFPLTEQALAREADEFPRLFIIKGLTSTDDRVASGKPVTPAFLFAVLLWEAMRDRVARLIHSGMNVYEAHQAAAEDIFAEQSRSVAVPRRFSMLTREIWEMQARLEARQGKRAISLMNSPGFRAAYDFLLLRAQAGEDVGDICDWWTRLQRADEQTQQQLISGVAASPAKKKRKRPNSRQRKKKTAPVEE